MNKEKKLNIVFITNNFPPIICGVGDYTAQLANTFNNTGNKVSVICTAQPGISEFPHPFDVYPIVDKWNYKSYKIVYKKIREIKPDVVFLQYVPYSFQRIGIPFLMLPFLLRLRFFTKTRIVTTYHELANGSGLKNIKYFLPSVLQFMVGYSVALISNRIIFSSYPVKKELGILSKKGILLPIGSGFNLSVKKDYSSVVPEIKIAVFGLSVFRNYYIYEILERLKKANYSASIIVLGKYDNKLRETLERKSSADIVKMVSFTGIVDNDTIDANLQAVDIFLMQDMVDKYGNGGMSTKSSVVGAIFSSGLPIIGTKGHLTADYYFKNMINCIIVENNVEDIVSSIITLINDSNLRRDIGSNARKTFDEFFSWPVISKSYAEQV